MDDNDIHFCGKLLLHVSGKKTAVIPDGIETLGYKFLVPDYWGAWDSVTTTVRIPASVKKIEEGAFSDSYVDKILIDPNSPCGIIKDKGLFTKDGKTLLFYEKLSHLRCGEEDIRTDEGEDKRRHRI